MMIKNVKQILNKAWVLLMMMNISCNAQDKSGSNNIELKKNTILYGVIDNDSIVHLTICNTDNFKKTLFEYKSYYKISNSTYINTKIYCESDFNLCSRTVTIKRKDDVVYYEYFIHNDREYLN